MEVIVTISLAALFLYGLYRFTQSRLRKADLPSKPRKKKLYTYQTSEFKIPKRINDGDPVRPYAVPDSRKINFYENNTYAGEGFLHKESDKFIWKIINENKDVSSQIMRTDKNKGVAVVKYKI